MGVGPDKPLTESFTPMSLSSTPLESNFFSHFDRQGKTPFSPIIDINLSFLEPLSGLHAPDVAPTGHEIRPEVPRLPSQRLDRPQISNSHRKIGPETQFLKQFMDNVLELKIDFIQDTLEDPVAFGPVPLPRSHMGPSPQLQY
ncbi:hypothetical protein N7457_006841 [Penicillium paradoxum]|uniref:uncharacterized protein n=1 Tax=Penicillium paradoxum TaxID=176176 RepID=UPI0025472082|nr:uncharacterized protein N7457_006841 [Penicillium paradoxum]KAJ5779121.1 hypothetical protein N7457_006841 [Penicillium paradoxum]